MKITISLKNIAWVLLLIFTVYCCIDIILRLPIDMVVDDLFLQVKIIVSLMAAIVMIACAFMGYAVILVRKI